jgi:hypothetical protein
VQELGLELLSASTPTGLECGPQVHPMDTHGCDTRS